MMIDGLHGRRPVRAGVGFNPRGASSPGREYLMGAP